MSVGGTNSNPPRRREFDHSLYLLETIAGFPERAYSFGFNRPRELPGPTDWMQGKSSTSFAQGVMCQRDRCARRLVSAPPAIATCPHTSSLWTAISVLPDVSPLVARR